MKAKPEAKPEDVVAIARELFRAHDEVVSGPSTPWDGRDVLGECLRITDRQRSSDAAVTEEGWQAAARVAIDLGARPRSVDSRARLAELVGPDSTNFFGTGLSLHEFMELHNAERVARSWSLQPREEKRRRLNTVMRLSVELTRIREITQFSTGLAEQAIESVIEGDWKMVESWTEIFAFEDDCHDFASIFAAFRELLLQALRVGKEGVA